MFGNRCIQCNSLILCIVNNLIVRWWRITCVDCLLLLLLRRIGLWNRHDYVWRSIEVWVSVSLHVGQMSRSSSYISLSSANGSAHDYEEQNNPYEPEPWNNLIINFFKLNYRNGKLREKKLTPLSERIATTLIRIATVSYIEFKNEIYIDKQAKNQDSLPNLYRNILDCHSNHRHLLPAKGTKQSIELTI